ncbi:MAG: bifunctional diguanylate cyclase/phosphodiesterase [Rhodoferax sp.]|nr:bifunctional diguanylate cyclase/phosphodiesterase [Rhodoferax sp.]
MLPWPDSVWIALAYGAVTSALIYWAVGACVWRIGRANPTLHRVLILTLAPPLTVSIWLAIWLTCEILLPPKQTVVSAAELSLALLLIGAVITRAMLGLARNGLRPVASEAIACAALLVIGFAIWLMAGGLDALSQAQAPDGALILVSVVLLVGAGMLAVPHLRRAVAATKHTNRPAAPWPGALVSVLIGAGAVALITATHAALNDLAAVQSALLGDWPSLVAMLALFVSMFTTHRLIGTLEQRARDLNLSLQLASAAAERARSEDPVTGLPNSRGLRQIIERQISISRAAQDLFSVLHLGVGQIKTIRGSLGQSKTDALIRVLRDRLLAVLPAGDMLARTGDDHFAIVSPEASSADGAVKLADAVLECLAGSVSIGEQEISVHCNIGIALFPNDSREAEALQTHAALAWSASRQAGPGGYKFFSNQISEDIRGNFDRLAALRRAISQLEFSVMYQPQFELAAGTLVGCEALLRWPQRDGSMVAPSEFIPMAERSGLIIPLGHFVLEESCRAWVRWQSLDQRALKLSVNVSAVQLSQSDFVEHLERVLDDTGMDPRCLCLEVTESVAMEDPDAVIERFRAVRALGVQLAIDDFGTGHSSLAYLKQLECHYIKIDRCFVSGATDDAGCQQIIASVVEMAASYQMQTIAEGVETEEQLQHLRRAGCDLAQGYLLGHPVPERRFIADFLLPTADTRVNTLSAML